MIEFVKCNRAKVSDAEVTKDFNWNYTQMETFVGQGRLYTRLIIPGSTLEYKRDSDSELVMTIVMIRLLMLFIQKEVKISQHIKKQKKC